MKRIIKNKKGDMRIDLTAEEWEMLQRTLMHAQAGQHGDDVYNFISDIICMPAENYQQFKNYVP